MSENQSLEQWLAAPNKAMALPEILARFTDDEKKIWPLLDGILTLGEIAEDAGVTIAFARGILDGWVIRGLAEWLFQGHSAPSSGQMSAASSSNLSSPDRPAFSSGGFQAVISSPTQSSGGFMAVTSSPAATPSPSSPAQRSGGFMAVTATPTPSSPVVEEEEEILEYVIEAIGEDSEVELALEVFSSAEELPTSPVPTASQSISLEALSSFDGATEELGFDDIVEEMSADDLVVDDSSIFDDFEIEEVEIVEQVASSPFERMTPPPASVEPSTPAPSPFEAMTPPPASVVTPEKDPDALQLLDEPKPSATSNVATTPESAPSPALRIPGASSGSFPASQGPSPALKIPGAASGSSPVLKIPGASSGSYPGASSASFDAAPRAASQENLRISGASSGSFARTDTPRSSSQENLRIPGASSGSFPGAGGSRETLRIPGASSGSFPGAGSGDMTTADSIQLGGLDRGGFSGSLDATAIGDHSALEATFAQRMEITASEEEAFVEVAEQVEDATSSRVKRSKQEWAGEIATAFGRVTRTFQLYDANNDAVSEALSSLFRQLMGFLKEHQKMLWVVQPFSLLLDGEKIYENDDREYSIAYKLHRDGIRGLTMFQGLNWEELAQLLKIFGMRYGGVHMFEDDVATLFWKSNFRHVEVIAIEGFGFERREEGEEPSIQLLFKRIQRIHSAGGGWKRAETPEQKASIFGGASGRGASLAPSVREENAQGLLRELSASPIMYHAPDEMEIKELHLENNLEKLHEQMAQLFRYIDKIVLDLSAVTGLEGLKHLLREYRNFLITDGRPQGLLELLKRADQWMQLIDNRGRILASLAEDLLHSFDDKEVVRRFLGSTKLLDSFKNIPEETYDVLSFGNRDRRPMLLDILEEEKSPRIKEVVRRVLVRLCGHDITLMLRGLQRGVTSLSLELIDCLHMVGSRESLEVIASLMESSNAELQEKVVGMAEDLFQGPETFSAVRGVLSRLIESDNTGERMRAYRLMEANEDYRWVPMLRKELQNKRVRGDQEVIEMARLAARLDAKSIAPLLLEWIEPPKMLSMERTWRKQLRLAAIYALGQTGTSSADRAIKKLMDRSEAEVKSACMDAMREIRRNRGVDPLALPKRLQRSVEEIAVDDLEGEATALADSRHDLVSSAQDVDLKRLQDMMIKSLQHIDFKTENEFASLVRDLGHQFVVSLHMMIKNRSLYDPNNEIFLRPLRDLATALDKMLEQLMGVTLVGMEGQFYINDVRIRTQSESSQQIFKELSELFNRLNLGGITFGMDLFENEWRLLIDYLSGQGEGEGRRNWRDIRVQLAGHNLGRKLELFGQLRTRLTGEKHREGARLLSDIFIDGCDAVEEIWFFVVRGQAPNPLPIRRFVNDVIDSLMQNQRQDLAILALEDPEQPLKTHWLQTTLLSLLIGRELQLSRAQLADLGMAAFFHDIGHTVFIDPEVRRGEGWQTLNHQQAGMGLLLKHRGFNEAKVKRLLAIMEHHANAVPFASQPKPALYSRIVRVADAYDTLTTGLIGGAPLSPTEALEHIASGVEKQFDPFAVRALVNVLGHYPPGTIVALNDGTIATSMGNDGTADNFERPRVLFLYNAQGEPLPATIIDLSEERKHSHQILGIVAHDPSVQPKKHIVHQVWPELVEAVWDETMFGLTSISPPEHG